MTALFTALHQPRLQNTDVLHDYPLAANEQPRQSAQLLLRRMTFGPRFYNRVGSQRHANLSLTVVG